MRQRVSLPAVDLACMTQLDASLALSSTGSRGNARLHLSPTAPCASKPLKLVVVASNNSATTNTAPTTIPPPPQLSFDHSRQHDRTIPHSHILHSELLSDYHTETHRPSITFQAVKDEEIRLREEGR